MGACAFRHSGESTGSIRDSRPRRPLGGGNGAAHGNNAHRHPVGTTVRPMEFNSSERSTLGVEVEYWVVDDVTGLPVACSVNVLAEAGAPYGGEHPKAKHELFQSSIEVITGICETPAEARADLQATIDELQPLLDARGVSLMSSGTHPYVEWEDLMITPNERYNRLVETIAWPAQRLMIHGVHVHVGVRSAEKSIATVNGLTTYLPHLLALSCSSPFWEGADTGMASVRTKIFEIMPTAGLPRGWTAGRSSSCSWTRSSGLAASRPSARSGGTSGRTPASAPLSCGCATASRRWRRSPRSRRWRSASSPGSTS